MQRFRRLTNGLFVPRDNGDGWEPPEPTRTPRPTHEVASPRKKAPAIDKSRWAPPLLAHYKALRKSKFNDLEVFLLPARKAQKNQLKLLLELWHQCGFDEETLTVLLSTGITDQLARTPDALLYLDDEGQACMAGWSWLPLLAVIRQNQDLGDRRAVATYDTLLARLETGDPTLKAQDLADAIAKQSDPMSQAAMISEVPLSLRVDVVHHLATLGVDSKTVRTIHDERKKKDDAWAVRALMSCTAADPDRILRRLPYDSDLRAAVKTFVLQAIGERQLVDVSGFLQRCTRLVPAINDDETAGVSIILKLLAEAAEDTPELAKHLREVCSDPDVALWLHRLAPKAPERLLKLLAFSPSDAQKERRDEAYIQRFILSLLRIPDRGDREAEIIQMSRRHLDSNAREAIARVLFSDVVGHHVRWKDENETPYLGKLLYVVRQELIPPCELLVRAALSLLSQKTFPEQEVLDVWVHAMLTVDPRQAFVAVVDLIQNPVFQGSEFQAGWQQWAPQLLDAMVRVERQRVSSALDTLLLTGANSAELHELEGRWEDLNNIVEKMDAILRSLL